MTNKKLGLLLLPLLPLGAIGIVEVASAIVRPEPVAAVEAGVECKYHQPLAPPQHVAPAPVPPSSIQFARPATPPVVAPDLAVAPAPIAVG